MKTPAPRPQKMAEHIAEQLRGQIVRPAARRLSEQHTAADLERLRQQRARCEAAVDDGSAFLDESTEFSLLIVELAGNQVLAVLSRLLAEVVRAHRQAMSAYFEAK